MTKHQIGPDDGFERWLEDAAPTLNDPPREVPRDLMWDDISRRLPAAGRPAEGRGPRAGARWTWPLMVAAALVLGAAIDRFVLTAREDSGAREVAVAPETTERSTGSAIDPVKPKPRPAGPERGGPAAEGREPAAESGRQLAEVHPSTPSSTRRGPSTAMRLAAQQTLAQAELLLTAYRTDDVGDRRDAQQLGRWARDVLSSTRLLLESRAANDATLRALLEDLELVLMQIAQLSGAPMDARERDLLDRTLRERELLPRIRSAVPAGADTYTTGASD